jgi:hypothetical protein
MLVLILRDFCSVILCKNLFDQFRARLEGLPVALAPLPLQYCSGAWRNLKTAAPLAPLLPVLEPEPSLCPLQQSTVSHSAQQLTRSPSRSAQQHKQIGP